MRAGSIVAGVSDRPASARICRSSPGSGATSAGSPSYGWSVVPSSRPSCHGTANATRPSLSIAVIAASYPLSADSTRCVPRESCTVVPAPGCSICRTRSIHGPLALTTTRARISSAPPPRRSTASAPVTRPPERAQPDDLEMVQHQRAGLGGAVEHRQREPRVVGEVVVVEHRRRAPGRPRGPAPANGASSVEEAVDGRRGTPTGRRTAAVPASSAAGPYERLGRERDEKRQRPHQMRGDDRRVRAPLRVRLTHQPHIAHREVAQAAVDELGRGARRRRRQVARVDQRHPQAGTGQRPGNAGAHHAAADHQHVEVCRLKLRQRLGAVAGGGAAGHGDSMIRSSRVSRTSVSQRWQPSSWNQRSRHGPSGLSRRQTSSQSTGISPP